MPATGFDNDAITLRGVLSHTAGLSVPGYLGFGPQQKPHSIEASLQMAADADHQAVRVIYRPGRSFHYSGGGYTVAQLMVEDVTGSSFARFAQSAVLVPLRMTESSFLQNVPHAVSYDAHGKR